MKKNSFSFVATIITLALSWGTATATGCGGVSTASLCGEICACERCTTNDLKTCEEQGSQAADQADAVGCSSQFEAFVTCADANVSCKKDRAVFDQCDAEQLALTTCSNTINVLGKNPCELAAAMITAKLSGCGVKDTTTSSSSGGTVECTDAAGAVVTCQAACLVAADCSVFVNDPSNPATSEQSQAFLNCVTKCQ